MYLWETDSWPVWSVDKKRVLPLLKQAEVAAERLLSDVADIPDDAGKEAQLDALIQSAIKTSSIEGEHLNVGSVRSSVARHLGIESPEQNQSVSQKEALVVKLLTEAVGSVDNDLTTQQLCQWQGLLFPKLPILKPIRIGALRADDKGPMQVVSERRGQITVHFEAPPAKELEAQLNQFLSVINDIECDYHGLVRAAWVHLFFITLHPFDDGNGRLARALTDRALWQYDANVARFCAMSAAIESNKAGYYEVLEAIQNIQTKEQKTDPMDVTAWVVWFLNTWIETVELARFRVDKVLTKALFWKSHAQTVFSSRQIKVLNKLLDEAGDSFSDGLAARHYQSIAKVSKATATRDLADLVDKGALETMAGGGRSVRYRVAVLK